MLAGETRFKFRRPTEPGMGTGSISGPSMKLLNEHLWVALLIHFRGVGKRRVARYEGIKLN